MWTEYDGEPETIEAIETMGAAVAAPKPTPGYPVEGDPRQKSVNAPAIVRQDASDLRELGYSAPDTGNAYDPLFQASVFAFQRAEGLFTDGLIGPTTRARLRERVAAQGGGGSVLVLPEIVVPGSPPTAPAPSGGGPARPVSTGSSSNAVLVGGLVLGALALVGGAYYLSK